MTSFRFQFWRGVFSGVLTASLAGCGGGSSRGSRAPTTPSAGSVAPLRVACIGDSITAGVGTSDEATKSWPATLGESLGAAYQVRNFGVPGATVSSRVLSYRAQTQFQAALRFKPDVVVVALGTNDSSLFDARRERATDFLRDYQNLLNDFKKVGANTKFYCCVPTPSFDRASRKDEINQSSIAPLIRQKARENGAAAIDLYAPLQNDGALFPDTLHPNDAGAAKIADEIYQAIKTVS